MVQRVVILPDFQLMNMLVNSVLQGQFFALQKFKPSILNVPRKVFIRFFQTFIIQLNNTDGIVFTKESMTKGCSSCRTQ